MSEHSRKKNLFTVKVHSWGEGKLETFERLFENFAHAFEFCKNMKESVHSLKIYDENNQLIHNQPGAKHFYLVYG
jgi:hypothetical protein